MFRKWWFAIAAMLLTAMLYRNRLHAYLEQASANVRAFDLPSAGAYDALVAAVLEGFARAHQCPAPAGNTTSGCASAKSPGCTRSA